MDFITDPNDLDLWFTNQSSHILQAHRALSPGVNEWCKKKKRKKSKKGKRTVEERLMPTVHYFVYLLPFFPSNF